MSSSNTLIVSFGFSIIIFVGIPSAEKILDHSVKCDPKQMHVFFEFESEFNGMIYAKDFFNSDDCRTFGNNSRKVSLSLPLNTDIVRKPYCGVKLNKSTHEFSAKLLVNDAKDILVSGLQYFEVVCLYHLQDVTVQLHSLSGIYIGTPKEDFQEDEPIEIRGDGTGVLPILDMAIRKGRGIEGEKILNAVIGQEMTLDVFLDDTAPYDIFVYNCIAHDGTRWPSGSVTLIDRNGCGMSIERVTEPPVATALDDRGIKHVFLTLRGFQFSTSEVVYFECQVKPCLHKCNITQCQIIRPGAGPLDSTTTVEPTDNEELTKLTESNSIESFNLHTKLSMEFRDPESDTWVSTGDQQSAPAMLRRFEDTVLGSKTNAEQNEGENGLCMSGSALTCILSAFGLACVFCVGAAILIWYKLRKYTLNSFDEENSIKNNSDK